MPFATPADSLAGQTSKSFAPERRAPLAAEDLDAAEARLRQQADEGLAEASWDMTSEGPDGAGWREASQQVARRRGKLIERLVQEHPLTALLAALGVGVLLGLVSRR